MDPEDEGNSIIFPDPPPFWKDFTTDNVARYADLKKKYAEEQGIDEVDVTFLPNLPEELFYLQPPSEPSDGRWTVFSQELSLSNQLETLESKNIARLTSDMTIGRDKKHTSREMELKRIIKSLLLNFLELMGILSMNPKHGAEKLADMHTLFMNFHHILNEYRPHQAREQLILAMQNRLDAARAETAATRSVVDKAKRALEGLGSISVPEPDAARGTYASTQNGVYPGTDGNMEDLTRQREAVAYATLDAEYT